jgi:phage FluMu protein Com
MDELRCRSCNKLLGKVDKGNEISCLELKCPRCGNMNQYGKTVQGA